MENFMIALLFSAFIVISIIIIRYWSEKRQWNNGTCVICKKRWKYLGKNKFGKRHYGCGCGYKFWIKYKFDMKGKKYEKVS